MSFQSLYKLVLKQKYNLEYLSIMYNAFNKAFYFLPILSHLHQMFREKGGVCLKNDILNNDYYLFIFMS